MVFISAIYSYLKDLLIASSSSEQHLQLIRFVFEHLTEHDIVINPCTCLFGVAELDLLGQHINSKGVVSLKNKFRPSAIFHYHNLNKTYDNSSD